MPQGSPKHIVVAVDFGDASAAAVDVAGRLASHFGARLTAVHGETLDVPPYFTHEQLDVIEAELQGARRLAESALRDFVRAHTNAAADVRIARLGAVESIVEAAGSADLVVMGTHGRRGPKRWWLGSVAERVVREAPVPVLVVHAPVGAPAGPRTLSGHILLLVGGEANAQARAWAESLGTALDTTVQDGPPAEQCATGGAQGASVVVVPLPARPGDRAIHGELVALARTCTAPVLFVPAGAR